MGPGLRRTLGLLVAALGLAACSSSPDAPSADPTSPTTASSAPSTDPSPSERPSTTPSQTPPSQTPTPPAPRPYRASSAEVDGPAKLAAARAVEALPEVARVTYTQYFGYAPPLASILVEADYADGGGTTYDVRISQSDSGRWGVDSIEPARRARAVDDPGSLVRRVLDSDRIELPWAGRRDVAAGRMSDSVLSSMLEVAEDHRITIAVLVSAHPVNVFGTDRRSNHPDGLAYDIGSIDGHLVVDPRYASLVEEVMRTAAGTGAYQVGGPDDLDDGGSQYFSDPTHSDHVHVGFRR